MIPFQGRLSLKQLMPMKPVKRDIKVWSCQSSVIISYLCVLCLSYGDCDFLTVVM